MMPGAWFGTLKKVGMFFFWTSPILIILLLSSVLTGYAASGPDSGTFTTPTEGQVLDWEIQGKLSPGNIQATPASGNFNTQLSQTQLISGAQTAGDPITSSDSFFSFLPLIFSFPFIDPQPSIDAYGPVMDPPVPGQVANIQSTVIVDPPTPAQTNTPTPTQTPTGTYTPPPTNTPSSTPSVTPKPSLTPTTMPTATREITEGGGFEDGGGGWAEYSLQDLNLIYDDDEGLPQAPNGAYEGDWYTWLGGADSEISYIERQLTVPNATDDDYRRYYLGHRIRIQSYDSVCATTEYPVSDFPSARDRDEFLAGHLRHATADSLDRLGVDLGGMLVCVNQSGQSGCSDSAVKTDGGQKMVYVSYYDLCSVADGSGWYVFLFPIDTRVSFPGPDLFGETITVQIKTVADSQLASSVLVDNVAWWEGPPLPTPTPTPAADYVQSGQSRHSGIQIANPIQVSDMPPDLTGARFIVVDAGQKRVDYPILSASPDAFIKKR